jgi:hypothetical protein
MCHCAEARKKKKADYRIVIEKSIQCKTRLESEQTKGLRLRANDL